MGVGCRLVVVLLLSTSRHAVLLLLFTCSGLQRVNEATFRLPFSRTAARLQPDGWQSSAGRVCAKHMTPGHHIITSCPSPAQLLTFHTQLSALQFQPPPRTFHNKILTTHNYLLSKFIESTISVQHVFPRSRTEWLEPD